MCTEDILVSYADFKWMLWVEDKVQWRGVNWNYFFAFGLFLKSSYTEYIVHYFIHTYIYIYICIHTHTHILSRVWTDLYSYFTDWIPHTIKVTAINAVWFVRFNVSCFGTCRQPKLITVIFVSRYVHRCEKSTQEQTKVLLLAIKISGLVCLFILCEERICHIAIRFHTSSQF